MRRKTTSRRTMTLPVSTLDALADMADRLNDIDREEWKFRPSTTRTRISRSCVAEEAIRIGLAKLALQHGFDSWDSDPD